MNVADSEVIGSVLAAQQYTRAPSPQQAGVVLLNTCAIRCARAFGHVQLRLTPRPQQQQRSLSTPLQLINWCRCLWAVVACRENAEARIWGRLGELQALKRQRRANKQ